MNWSLTNAISVEEPTTFDRRVTIASPQTAIRLNVSNGFENIADDSPGGSAYVVDAFDSKPGPQENFTETEMNMKNSEN
jgi:hypothetical protein